MTKQRAGGRRIAAAVSQVSGLSLDFKIGLRVLVKHRAVTLLAGVAIAFAIAICTATFEIVANVRKPTIPLEDGGRLVAVQLASLAGGLAALLAVSGVYAVLSLIVARRTREIGIRLALGAGRWHIVSAVFSKALLQVGTGVLAGAGMLWVFESLARTRLMEVPLLAASFAVLLGAGIAACAPPIWRALRIQPTEAILAGR